MTWEPCLGKFELPYQAQLIWNLSVWDLMQILSLYTGWGISLIITSHCHFKAQNIFIHREYPLSFIFLGFPLLYFAGEFSSSDDSVGRAGGCSSLGFSFTFYCALTSGCQIHSIRRPKLHTLYSFFYSAPFFLVLYICLKTSILI